MELSKEKIKEIVAMLKHADGEDVQEILIDSGWNKQMLHQLMMCESINDVNYIYQERLSLLQSIKNTTSMKNQAYKIYNRIFKQLKDK